MVFVVVAWLGNFRQHRLADVVTAFTCLLQGFTELVKAQAFDLDVHLAGSDAFRGTSDFEVHVTEVVLIPKDVRKDGVLARLQIGDQPHGNA